MNEPKRDGYGNALTDYATGVRVLERLGYGCAPVKDNPLNRLEWLWWNLWRLTEAPMVELKKGEAE